MIAPGSGLTDRTYLVFTGMTCCHKDACLIMYI